MRTHKAVLGLALAAILSAAPANGQTSDKSGFPTQVSANTEEEAVVPRGCMLGAVPDQIGLLIREEGIAVILHRGPALHLFGAPEEMVAGTYFLCFTLIDEDGHGQIDQVVMVRTVEQMLTEMQYRQPPDSTLALPSKNSDS